jgi:anti-sigma regulatory factor (Ser/Thr protein kinase)
MSRGLGMSGTTAARVGPADRARDAELACAATAPARARAEVRLAIAGMLDGEQADAAVLLTSELVTNAVIHPRQAPDAAIGLRIQAAAGHVRVEVRDRGSGFEPGRPDTRRPRGGGLGLALVEALASRWGAGPETVGGELLFCVWFEVGSILRGGYRRQTVPD